MLSLKTGFGEFKHSSNSIWKNNSTGTTLLRLIEDWKASLEKREVIGVSPTDMSKAFDSMYPELLL